MELMRKYDEALKRSPVRTKATMGVILSAIGNAMGQYRASNGASIDKKMVFLFSMRGMPPWSHWWFNILDAAFPKLPILGRLLLDQLLWRPILHIYSFVAMGLLTGSSPRAIRNTISEKFRGTVIAGLKFGMVTQTANLYMVPLRWRTTFWEFASLFWNIYLTIQCGLKEKPALRNGDEKAKTDKIGITSKPADTQRPGESEMAKGA